MINLRETSLCVMRTQEGILEIRDMHVRGQRAALPSHMHGLGQVQGPAHALMVYDEEHVLQVCPDTLQPTMRVRAAAAPLSALSVSSDGHMLACLDLSGQLSVLHIPTGKRWRLPVGATQHDTLAMSPDGQWLAWGYIRDKQGGVRLWRLNEDGPTCIAHTLDRRHVDDPTRTLTRPGHLRIRFNPYTVVVYASCQCLPAEATEGWRASLQCYDLAQGGLLWQASLDATLTADPRPIHDAVLDPKRGASGDIVLTPDGRKLYVASSSGLCCALDARDGALAGLLTAPTSIDVHQMMVDAHGHVWVQSAHDALLRLHT